MSSVVCGFAVRKDYKGQDGWDETYKDIELKKKLVPLGPADENGEIPYVEELVEIVHETPIKDVIAAQEDSCGLEAYLKPYRAAGMNPPGVEFEDGVQDFTIFDGGEDIRCSGMVEKIFSSLPQDLQAEYGSPEKLLKEINDVAIESYAKKVIEASKKKAEEKVEEEK